MSIEKPSDDPLPDEGSGEPRGESAEDHAYFLALEDLFIRLRGAPLLLSPKDWQTAREWRREGIPLELVRRTLEEVFERRRKRGADRPVSSLRYCARAVKGAWAKVQELTAAGERGEAPAFDLPGRLAALAAALPEDLPDRPAWGGRITALGSEMGDDMERVEEALARLDEELLPAAEGTLDDAGRKALTAEVSHALTALAGRLSKDELERSRGQLRRRLLRRRLRLPVLSLFAPEAEGE
jgi:hypothetical protein